MFDLTGKIALVTGSARGLGKGIALALAEQGADVIVNCARSVDKAEDVAAQIRAMGRRSAVYQADVGIESEVLAMFEKIRADFGKLDILVNNAGTQIRENVFEMSTANWEFILRNNLTSAYLCTREALKFMTEQNWGRIIYISSITALQGSVYGVLNYGAAKAGMIGLAKSLFRNVAKYNITVNAVAPGVIATEQTARVLTQKDIDELGIPLGLGEMRDIGAACAYLASDEAKYVTGATLDVTGGLVPR